MSQGVALYVAYASDVLLICWFGTQLTQHVRNTNYVVMVVVGVVMVVVAAAAAAAAAVVVVVVVVVVNVAVRTSHSCASEVSLQPGRQLQLPFRCGYFSVLSGLL